jgi:hypothetical protein
MANAGGMAAMHVWNIFDEVDLIDRRRLKIWLKVFSQYLLAYGFTLL